MTNFKRVKFIEANYDPETKVSVARVKCGNKIYEGYAKAVGEDADKPNKYRGCAIAEFKATRKAFKETLNEMKKEYNAVHQFVLDCLQNKDFNRTSKTAKIIFKQENILLKRIELGKEIINRLNFFIHEESK